MTHSTGRHWTIQSIRRFVAPGGPCQFAVTLERGEEVISDLLLEASELLEYRAFREHILKTSGRLVRFPVVEDAGDPAVAWLDLVQSVLPDEPLRKPPASGFIPSQPAPHEEVQDGVPQEIGGGD